MVGPAKKPETPGERIRRILAEHPRNTLTIKQLYSALELPCDESAHFEKELALMVKKGEVLKTGRSSYGLPERLNCRTGVLQGHRRGYAFLRSATRSRDESDIYIRSSKLNGAMHGDRVVVRLHSERRRSGRRREGEVIAVLRQGTGRLVGTLERKGRQCFVVPDEERYGRSIRVPARTLRRVRPGDKVVVQVERRESRQKELNGAVVEHLGPAGAPGTEEEALRHRFELPGDFPRAVDTEVQRQPGEETVESLAREQGRRDLRDLYTVTIDGEQAKDFDDAITLEETTGGCVRLGVHIADVTQYVREGGALDREAFKRGTSIYPVGTVIPMLPPRLSEELCSLQCGQDRLAVSVLMDLDPEGELRRYEFFPSLVRVDRRLTYRSVEAFLEQDADLDDKTGALGLRLRRMDRLAGALRRRRLQRGALDLDLPEAEIILDKAGYPVDVELRHLGRSESLIEEFMLLCNETIAAHFCRAGLPFLYRIHAVPTMEKMVLLRDTLSSLGYTLEGNPERMKPQQLQKLLDRSKGAPEEKLVRFLLLRSLPQACYSADNIGHFGLGSRIYTHFTAPIRRYPDLVVHRILKEHQAAPGGVLKAERIRALEARLPDVALHSSERERLAMEAERASADMMKARFMESKIGEEYPGIISGLTNFGIFVELENTVEGMVSLSSLTDDYYIYQEKQAALIGERTRRTFRLGDAVRVQVIRASWKDGRITFTLIGKCYARNEPAIPRD